MPDNPPVAAGTRIGHVHLKVADLDRALGFYCGVLGFEVMQRMSSGAAFISAGGYHHHIGLEYLGKQRRPSAAAGNDGPVSHRDSVSDAAGIGRCLASRDQRRHSTRWRQRSRRQRGAVSARSRPERRRALLGPSKGTMAAQAGRLAFEFTHRLDLEDLLRQREG